MRMKMIVKTNKVNVSQIRPKRVKGIETFQMRMKMNVKTNKNQRVSDLWKKRQRNKTF